MGLICQIYFCCSNLENMKNIFIATVGLLFLNNGSLPAQAQATQKQANLQNGLALKGYDPVSYFSAQKAVKGDSKFAITEKGVTYYFSSRQNMEEFKKNPPKFEPQYGGRCAFAMGKD